MGLSATGKRSRGCDMATGSEAVGRNWRSHRWHLHRNAMAVTMTIEITGSMTRLAITAASRSQRGISSGGVGSTGGGVVTGVAGIMNLIARRPINRNCGGSAGGGGMAGLTLGMIPNPG